MNFADVTGIRLTNYICLFVIVAGMVWLNRLTYAIADDYHFYTFYAEIRRDSYWKAVINFLGNPFAAGRPVAVLFDVAGITAVGSIEDFHWIRAVHAVMLLALFLLVAHTIIVSGISVANSYILTTFLFAHPGLWHLYMVDYGSGVIAGALFAAGASFLVSRSDRQSIYGYAAFSVLAALAIFSYQPVWPLALLGSMMRYLRPPMASDRRDLERSFLVIGAIVFALLVLNLVYAMAMGTPRFVGGQDAMITIRYLLLDLTPMAILPWIDFFAPRNVVVVGLSIAIALTVAVLVVQRIGRPSSLVGFALLVVTSSGALPFLLAMYGLTDQSEAYRRVLFGAMPFWAVGLASITLARGGERRPTKCVLAVVVSLVVAQVLVIDITTQKVAAKEWASAKCASVEAPASQQTASINRRSALAAMPQAVQSRYWSDEFGVRTLSFPSGGMLFWLSHRVANGKADFSPWQVKFHDGADLGPWDQAFASCAVRCGAV